LIALDASASFGGYTLIAPQTGAGEVVWEYGIRWFTEHPDAAAHRTVPRQHNSVFQIFRCAREQVQWLRDTGQGSG
jgi:hypothetical protein